MTKKIVLFFILILSFIYMQGIALADNVFNQNNYEEYLKQTITDNWFKPENSEDKSAVITFTVKQDGSLSNISFIKSSNDNVFDKSIILAVNKSQPFTEIPTQLNVKMLFSNDFRTITSTSQNIYNSKNIINVSNKIYAKDTSFYTDNLAKKISTNWKPKHKIKAREAVFLISVGKDGAIQKIKMQKSSYKKSFDNEIIDSILKSAPFGRLPGEVKANHKDIQLSFNCRKKHKTVVETVTANMLPQDNLDEYMEQVEQIVSDKFNSKCYFCKKDFIVTMNIEKTGTLKYAKLKHPDAKAKFIRKECQRKTLLTLYKTPFPPIPEEVGSDNVTADFRIVSHRERFFKNFLCDYLFHFFRTSLNPYYIHPSENI